MITRKDTIGGAGELRNLVCDVHHGVHVKQAVYVLANNGQTLQAHAGINVFLSQFGIIALAVIVELGEDVVPDFHITVAIAANRAVRLAAAVLLTAVIVNLRAGAAGTGAMLPEIIGLTKPEDPVSGYTDFFIPDFKRLIVILVDGRIQSVFVQTNYLGQEFPAPGNGFMFEVVTEGEITQHLKIGAMAGGFTDVLNITGTDALLAGAHPMTGRLHLTGEIGLHGCHAGVDQQQRSIILGNQGKAGQAQMALTFEEREKHLTQFVYAIGFLAHWFDLQKTDNVDTKNKPRPYP